MVPADSSSLESDPNQQGAIDPGATYYQRSSLENPESLGRVSGAKPLQPTPKHGLALLRYNKTSAIVASIAVLLILGIGVATLLLSGVHANNQAASVKTSDKYSVKDLAVSNDKNSELSQISQADSLKINGSLQVASSIVVAPTTAPTTPTTGQLYFDKASGTLKYYNGNTFVSLGAQPQAVDSLNGRTGAINTSTDFVLNGNQLSLSNDIKQSIATTSNGGGISSVQGQTGAVQFASGNGIAINGTTISNTGILSATGTNGAQVSVANGQLTIALAQDLSSAATPTFAGLQLGSALGVAYGGTGLNTGNLVGNSVLITNPAGTGYQLATGTVGNQCLITDPADSNHIKFAACPSATAASVVGHIKDNSGTSLNGDVTIVAGGNAPLSVTADSGTNKVTIGLSYNTTNLKITANQLNTIQDVAPTSDVSFKSLALTNALPITSGGTGQTTAAAALGALGGAAKGANSDITSLTGLATALSVSQGGTGLTTVSANQILIGGAGNTITQLANGTTGQCLVANASGAPTFQTCTGAGGVSTVDGLTGAIALDNSTGAAGHITIADAKADGSTKGIAAFNSTNFSDAAGVINTIQGIATTSTPTFASLTLTSALTVANGGTGSGTPSIARGNLGAAASGANSDITSLTGLTTALSVAQGGTGSSTPSVARTNLGAASSGANSDITSITGLTTALSVAQGGTGFTTITPNQLLVGGASNTVTQVTNGTTGQCLVANASGAPTFQTCTGAGGVSTLDGLAGALTLANSTGAGSTVTINNAAADGTTKGIAAFVSSNFSASSGVISIKTGGVTTTEIADGTITTTDIASGTITGSNIAGTTVTNSNLVNSAVTVAAGTGLSGGGSISLGGSSTLSVAYGSTTGTAVQGNVTLTCPTGAGNLSGGGNSIALGAGGSCSAINITNSPIFSGTLAVQGSGGITVGANSVAGLIKLSDGAATSHTATISTVGTLASNQTYNLPTTGGTVCVLEAGNCTGTSSGAITTSGTPSQNYLTKFSNAGGTTIGNSSIYNDATGVSIGGSSPAALFNVGATNQFQVSTIGAVTAVGVSAGAGLLQGTGGLTIGGTTKLTSLTSAGGQCLTTDGTGTVSLTTCLSGAGGGAGGVASLNGLSGTLTVANASGSGSTVTIDNAKADGSTKGIAAFNGTNFTATTGVIDTVQNINSSATPTFGGLTLSTALALTSGGTGSSTAAGARTNLGAAASGANNDITSLTGLTTALSVSQGGTGRTTITADQILIGGASNSITQLASGTTGQCLVANASGAPTFQTCTGAGGVSSLDGLTGAITLDNSAGAAGHVTINNAAADGATKGIASFNSTNFTASGGVINTIQGIATTSTPTFASLTLTSALSVANGGTGSTSASGARSNIGAAASGANSDITSITGLTSALSVSQGGTGLTTVTANQILIGGASNSVSQLANGTIGQCLVANGVGSAPTFQTCTGAGGVSSLDGLAGALTLANSTGTSSTITINDAKADGLTKGIAAFNSTNFTASSGVINTAQDIATSATPTFAGLNLSTALTVANGGTGATTASSARTNIGAAASGANSDITSLSGLTTALSVSQGGTGLNTVTVNQLLIGGASSSITQVTNGTTGQCLVANGTGSAPTFQTCTGAGGVSSLDGLTGAISLANSSGSAGTITINDAKADGSTKGIAAFNSSNFTDASGVINTIQGIAATSTPTFASLSLSSALSVSSGGTGLASVTANRILLGGASNTITQLGAGTTGQCLLSNGSGAAPSFQSCAAGSGSGVTTVGTIDSQTKSSDGAVISGTNIYLQTADGSNPGLVSTGTQTFAGDKTLANALTVTGVTTLNSSVNINGTELTTASLAATGSAHRSNVTNGNTSATATNISGEYVALTGTANSNGNVNTNNAFFAGTVTPTTGNVFNAFRVGTGFDSILNYNGTPLISGTGKLQDASLDSSLTYSNLQKVTNLTLGTGAGTGNIVVGSTAGTGSITNNGSTVNTVDTLSDFATNGTLVQTAVDNYTYIAIPQATASVTVTIPAPTASTTYGRIIYVSNTGTSAFNFGNTYLTASLKPGATATLIWANVNGTASWTYAGADGSGILNQTTQQANGNFNIQAASGTVAGVIRANGGDILDFYNSTPSLVGKITANGSLSLTSGTITHTTAAGSTGNATEASFGYTNNNTSATATTVTGLSVNLSGSANATGNNNITQAINLGATAQTGNLFYAININNTAFTDTLRYNGTTLISGGSGSSGGKIQNAALDTSLNYSNLQNVTNLNINGGGLAVGAPSSATIPANGVITFYNAANTNAVTIRTASQANAVALTIPADTNTTDTICLQSLGNCGSAGAATSIGALDGGGTTSANGAYLTSNVLYLQSASSSYPGVINTTTQTLAGNKTFNNNLSVIGQLSLGGTSTQSGTSASSTNLSRQQITNTNTSSTVANTYASTIALIGTANSNVGANNLYGVNLNSVSPVANNKFYAFNVGTGFNDILRYNDTTTLISGAGLIQNAALDSNMNYSNLQNVTNLTATGTLAVTGNTTLAGNLAINGGTVTTSASTVNLFNTTPNTINFGGAATALNIGASTGATTVNNALTVTGATTLNNALTVNGAEVTNASIGATGSAHRSNITNTNTSATAASISGEYVALTGTSNTNGGNTNNAFFAGTITPTTGNTFNAFRVGTGFDSILNYNGTPLISGTGKIQDATFDSTLNYASLQSVTNLTATGNIVVGSTAGTGSLTNNGSTVNTVDTVSNFASNGTLAQTAVDNYTYAAIPQTTASIVVTVPAPTASTTYGRIIYITNTGTASFSFANTYLTATLKPGATATLIWSNVNGTANWTYAGADGSGILNQTTLQTSANFNIQGASDTVTATFKGATGATNPNIANFITNSGTTIATIDYGGKFTFSNNITSNFSGGASGTELNLNLSSSNSSATVSNQFANAIGLTGATNTNAGANNLTAIRFKTVNQIANNTFVGLDFRTGYDTILGYNDTTLISGLGKLQDATFDSTLNYASLQKVTNLTATGNIAVSGYSGAGSALSVTSTTNPASGSALVYANNTATTPSGSLLDLRNKGTAKFTVDVNGNVIALGTFTSGSAGQFTINASGNAATSGTLVVQGSGGITAGISSSVAGKLTLQSPSSANATVFQTSGNNASITGFTGSLFLGGAGTSNSTTISANGSLQVLNSVGTALLNVPTGGSTITINGALSVIGDITVGGHLITSNTTGSTTMTGPGSHGAGTILGMGSDVAGNDVAGTATWSDGTLGGPGDLVRIVYAHSYDNPPNVVITPGNLDSAKLNYYVESDEDGFYIAADNAVQGTEYTFSYHVFQ